MLCGVIYISQNLCNWATNCHDIEDSIRFAKFQRGGPAKFEILRVIPSSTAGGGAGSGDSGGSQTFWYRPAGICDKVCCPMSGFPQVDTFTTVA